MPLLYAEAGGGYAVIASKGGAVKDPAWAVNLRANPAARVELGGKSIAVKARTEGEEYEQNQMAQGAALAKTAASVFVSRALQAYDTVFHLHPVRRRRTGTKSAPASVHPRLPALEP